MYYNADLLDIDRKQPEDMALGFIDDIAYGVAGDSDKGNVRRLKGMLEGAEKWHVRHGAKFEWSKYLLVHFTRNRHKPTMAKVTINGATISPSEEAQYLGVIFDKEMRFKSHLQQAIK